MDINVRKRSHVFLVHLRGPLRLGEAVDGLRKTLEELLGSGEHNLVIDLSEVPMIDSSGIGIVVRYLATTKARGGSVKLLNPSQFAVRTLKLVGVLNLFEVFDNEEKAVESFGRTAPA